MRKGKRILSLILLCGTLFLCTAQSFVSSASAGTVTSYRQITWGLSSGLYGVNGIPAFCSEYLKDCPTVGTQISSIELCENQVIRKAMYYGYNGPANVLGMDEEAFILTSIAISDANIGEANTGVKEKYDVFYWDLVNYPEKYPEPPEHFKAYLAHPAKSSMQRLAFFVLEDPPEIPITVLLKKVDASGNVLAGAEFEVKYYSSDEIEGAEPTKTWTCVTDEEGYAYLNETLTLGTLTIQEIKAPKGYQVNPEILVQKLTSKGYEYPTVQNEKLPPYRLLIEKKDDFGNRLEGAEFALYADEACQVEVAKGVTGTDGGLTFSDLEVCKHYYLKETKAPAGYYQNETVYPIYKEESKDIQLEVLNEVEIVLPKTGSAWTAGIPLTGSALCGLSLYFRKKKRRNQI